MFANIMSGGVFLLDMKTHPPFEEILWGLPPPLTGKLDSNTLDY